MSKVETKADLLKFMEKHGACLPAFTWVKSREEETFLEIWNACPHDFWLYWLMGKQDPKLAVKWCDYVYAKIPNTKYSFVSYDEEVWRLIDEARLTLLKRAYRG